MRRPRPVLEKCLECAYWSETPVLGGCSSKGAVASRLEDYCTGFRRCREDGRGFWTKMLRSNGDTRFNHV